MKKRPNIVCFIMDDTDFSNISVYGGNIETPNIDRIGLNGMIFTRFYCSASVCTPSRYSYMSGRYAGRCGFDNFIKNNPRNDVYNISWNVVLTEDDPARLGYLLSDAGYNTGYVGKWHAGRPVESLNLPFFDQEEDPMAEDTDKKLRLHQSLLCEELKYSLGFDYAASIYWNNAEGLPLRRLRYHNIDWITQGALDFLDNADKDDSKPFFLYMATTTYHGPDHLKSFEQDPVFTPGGKCDSLEDYVSIRKNVVDRIRNSGKEVNHRTVGMTWTDESFGAIVKKVEELGEIANTVFIFSVDHNTENGKGTCYELGVRIPFMISWQGVVEAGSVSNSLAQNIDLLPTLLDIAGIESSDELQLDGKSMFPIFTNEKAEIHDDLYFEFGFSRGVSTGKWKYIAVRYNKDLYEEMSAGILKEAPNLNDMAEQGQAKINIHAFQNCLVSDQLYNLEDDPLERINLATDPKCVLVLKEMRQRLKKYTDTFEHPFPMEPSSFHTSDDFKKLVENAKNNHSIEDIPWYNKDKTSMRGWPLDFSFLSSYK